MVINSHFYNGDNFPITSRIMLSLQATGVVGIRPCLFLFPSCLESSFFFFPDPSFILKQCPFCPHHIGLSSCLTNCKNISPLKVKFVALANTLKMKTWSAHLTLSFCFRLAFCLLVFLAPLKIVSFAEHLRCFRRDRSEMSFTVVRNGTHPLPALRSKGS